MPFCISRLAQVRRRSCRRKSTTPARFRALRQVKDVAYKLRYDLFIQGFGAPGPGQFEGMLKAFNKWQTMRER